MVIINVLACYFKEMHLRLYTVTTPVNRNRNQHSALACTDDAPILCVDFLDFLKSAMPISVGWALCAEIDLEVRSRHATHRDGIISRAPLQKCHFVYLKNEA